MKNPWSAFSSRQKLVLLIGGCIFLIIIAVMLMLHEEKRIGQENTGILPTAVPQSVQDVTAVPTYKPESSMRWKSYSGNNVSFQYPPDWKVEASTIAGGGDVYVVSPLVLPNGIHYPQFLVQTQPLTDTAASMKAGILEGFGLVKSSTKVANLPAQKFTGSIPFKTVGNQTVKEPIQDTTYLITRNDTLYVLKYEYEGNQPSDMLEDFFSGFTESFKIGQ